MNSDNLKMWAEACKIANVEFCSKGSNDYVNVKKVFDGLKKVNLTPELQVWTECCKELNYGYVKKGTAPYDQVKALFITKMRSAEGGALP